jgi:hypothetical protein
VTVPRTICCWLFAALLGSCAFTPQKPSEHGNYPGTLQAPQALATEAVWQQRVTAKWQAPGEAPQERGFDAALQRSGDALTVIGLSPMGSVGFSIQQTPSGIEVVNNMEDQLVIPPRFILLDVQRTFFPWIAADDSHALLANGTHSAERNGEAIREVWLDGRLQQRTFRRLDNQPVGEICIRYEWQAPDWALPSKAVLDNGWFGYQLTILTHSETRLAPKETELEAAGESK